MRTILTSAFLWRFVGGFALGGIGVLTMHPAAAQTVQPASIAAAVR